MISQERTDSAFENLSAASELAKMLHGHFQAMADMDKTGALSQASGESLALALRRLVAVALEDLERQPS